MRTPKDSTRSHSPTAEAIEWFVFLDDGELSGEQQKSFADWLRRSPVHVQEFLQLTALRGDLSRLPNLHNIDVKALLSSADAANADNIIPLSATELQAISLPAAGEGGARDYGRMREAQDERSESFSIAATFRRSSGKGRAWVIAASFLVVVAAGFWSIAPIRGFFGTERYTTAIGEQRSVTLADGSRVQLNVRSELTAKVNEAERELHLEEGEALFEVAKDSAHPFRVRTPQATIEAIGTQFNVHVTNGETVVALIEGKVAITPNTPLPATGEGGPRDNGRVSEMRAKGQISSSKISLNPGEQLTIAAHTTKPPAPRAVDLKTVMAWTERRLVFEDAPLSQVIEEFNRYSRQPLSIADPALRNVRITASFDSGSAQTFADSLAAAGALKVTRQLDGTWLIQR